MSPCVFLFRRDLRVIDNTALNAAAKSGSGIVPVFVLTPEQINPSTNKYFSNAAVQFMCESLADLDAALTKLSRGTTGLIILKGTHIETLEILRKAIPTMSAVFCNQDYSVYAKARDKSIADWCKTHNISFNGDIEDYDLVPASQGLLPDGRPYTNLSQYYEKFTKGDLLVRSPATATATPRATDFVKTGVSARVTIADLSKLYTHSSDLAQQGGRTNGLKVLANIKKGNYKKYNEEHDYPAIEGTTKASAHLHFGTISIREMFHSVENNSPLKRELVFRSFYLKIYSLRPELQRGVAFRKELDEHLKKSYVPANSTVPSWKAWTEGKTGFPLADAGMRQLAKEGWVHNRVRMLVAVTATRYLLHDWRDCARFFYAHLVDADTFSNTAGWQWSSGIGPDAVPYFRAPMNPFIQSKKFDNEAIYIKRWIPELADVPAKDIHKWDDEKIRKKYPNCTYPAPIIAQKEASRRAVTIMKAAHTHTHA